MGVAYQQTGRRIKGLDTLSRGSVQVGGESIYYEASGMAEHGPTVLFLHESGGSLATWHGQLVGLAGQGRCLVLDLPGHGRSEGTGRTTVQGYRDLVLGFLDALAIRWPVVLAGVCLGAAVAVDVAVHAPGRVAGLILTGTDGGGRATAAEREAVRRGDAPEAFIQQLFGPKASERVVHEQLQRWRLAIPLVRHSDINALAEYPLEQVLTPVTLPVLIMAGEEDSIATPESVHALARRMFDARVAVVPKAGCLSMLEQPAAFNRVVGEFLGNRLRPACPVAPESRSAVGYRRRPGGRM